MVEAETEAFGDARLNPVHFGAVLGDRLAGLGGGQLGGGAMFVRGAQKQHLVAAGPVVAGKEIGGQLGADEIAQVLDPVDIGDRGCDQVSCHCVCAFSPRFPRGLAQGGEADQWCWVAGVSCPCDLAGCSSGGRR